MFFLLRISRLNRPFWCITWFWGVPFCFRTTSVGFSIESWTLARLPGNFYRYLVQTKSLLQGLTGLALWSISANAFWSAQSRRRSNTRKSKLGSSQYDRVNSTKDQKDRHALSMHKLDAFLKDSEFGLRKFIELWDGTYWTHRPSLLLQVLICTSETDFISQRLEMNTSCEER